MDERESLRQRLQMAQAVLNILEQQAAGFGKLHVPAHLLVELEEKQREVASLEARLAQLEGRPWSRLCRPARRSLPGGRAGAGGGERRRRGPLGPRSGDREGGQAPPGGPSDAYLAAVAQGGTAHRNRRGGRTGKGRRA